MTGWAKVHVWSSHLSFPLAFLLPVWGETMAQKTQMNKWHHLKPVTDQGFVNSDNKGYPYFCVPFGDLLWFCNTLCSRNNGLNLPQGKRNVIYGDMYFPFLISGYYHFNYSLSFNPDKFDICFAIREIKIYWILALKKKASVHLRGKHTLCHL